jgi:hypothetical protein
MREPTMLRARQGANLPHLPSRTKLKPAEAFLVELIGTGLNCTHGPRRAPEIDQSLWPAVVEAADTHALGPVLYASLLHLPQARPREKQLNELRINHARWSLTNWTAFRELGDLLEFFDRGQIPVVVLKGAALAPTLYPDISLRPISDIDLLVHRADLDRAASLLAGSGFNQVVERGDRFEKRFFNEQYFFKPSSTISRLELHWHVLNISYYRQHAPIEWFWQRTVPFSLNGRRAVMLDPGAQLLHLCSHLFLKHRNNHLRWSYDIALLLARYGEQIDWAELTQAAKKFKLGLALRAAIRHIYELWQVPIPQSAWERLEKLDLGFEESVVYALTTANHRRAGVLVSGLYMKGLRAKLEFLAGILIPSPDYLRQRYPIRNPFLLPYYYLRHLVRGIANLP